MEVIEVDLAGRSYGVRIAPHLLDDFAVQAREFYEGYHGRAVPFVADANTQPLFRGTIENSLASEGFRADWFVVEPGEGAKSWRVLEELVDWLLERGVERCDHVFALGGGVVGDLTGFAAAILKRGCHFVQIPTTLLAQVDSSVGGKTAINARAGKNLIGAFHQPAAVLIDPETLRTLPDREMRAGFAEVLKYGVLGDREFFDWLEANGEKVLARDPQALTHAIARSVKNKARIVAEDEREVSGRRALLNLGHTFGHALEAETGFGERLRHGEAVALGMALAARYSMRRKDLREHDAERIEAAIRAAGLPTRPSDIALDCPAENLLAHMLHDKKVSGGRLPLVLLRAVGKAYLARDVDQNDLRDFLERELSA